MKNIEGSYIDYYNRAINSISYDNMGEALSLLEKAYFLNSQDIDTMNLLGLLYFKNCDFKKAIKLWEKSKGIKKEENKALDYLSFFREKKVTEDRELYLKALDLIEKGDFNKALDSLLKINNEDYGFLDLELLIGLIYIKKKNYKKALSYLEVVLKRDKGDKRAKRYKEKLEQNKKYKKRRILFLGSLIFLIIAFSLCISFLLKSNKREQGALIKENTSLSENLSFKEEEIKSKDKEIREKEKLIKTLEDKINSLKPRYEEGDKLEREGVTLLSLGLKDFKEEEYENSLKYFKDIKDGEYEAYLKNEALFWSAQAYEKRREDNLAIECYKEYIKSFKNECYYDDSLYNLCLLLEKEGDLKEAKIYAKELKNQCGNSIFNNKNIEKILRE